MEIRMTELSHIYNHLQEETRALDRISLTIAPGEFIAVLGPSGCGKSTLLRLTAGLLKPTGGSILINGQPPEAASSVKQISWMSQSPALLPWYTVSKNIQLARQVNPQGQNGSTPESLLEMMGLLEYAGAYPHELSGGMQQRAALARTLSLNPRLWLMDEPFASLDALTREALGREVLELWQRFHPTVVWVTHNIHEATLLADRVLVLSRRPARIISQVLVNLERPRFETQPGYQEAVLEIRHALGVAI